MPHPLPKPTPLFSGPHILDQRPKLAPHIAKVANMWSMVESVQGQTMANLMRADPEAGVAIFHALASWPTRKAALEATADLRLSGATRKEFEKLLNSCSGPQGERNNIVHGLWFISAEFPSALICARPQEISRYHAGYLASLTTLAEPRSPELDHRRYFIWEESDFLATEGRIMDLHEKWSQWWKKFLKGSREQATRPQPDASDPRALQGPTASE